MNTTIELLTPRIHGTPIAREHFDEIRILHRDPRVTATLSVDGKPFVETDTRVFLNRCETHWRAHGFGLWLLRLNDTDEFVGYAGIKHAMIADRDDVELAYAIRPEFWRTGLATEASKAALKFGFETLRLVRIVAMTLPHNRASRTVMEKCGFSYDREIVHVGLPHVLYLLEENTFHQGTKTQSQKSQL
jgi:ribosomal-protein-alanine N-acetyltransferase